MRTKQELDELLRNVAVHCPTEEEANKVLKLADEVGYRWVGGISFLKYTHYNANTDRTCYGIKDGQYGSIKGYQKDNYKIISSQEFINLVKGKDMKKKEFTKADLKSGMVVKLRNGEKYLVVDNLLITFDGFMRLDSYNLNMINANKDIESYIKIKYDIMEVYAKTDSWGGGFKNLCHGKLLWKRKEIEHFTKEDIAKMIGKNVDDFTID